jgi:hypothetical protein
MIDFCRERFGNDWSDVASADPLVTVIELLAYAMDNLHYSIDMQKRESDIVTSVIESNVIKKAIRDGYKPYGYKAAYGIVTLDFAEPLLNPVTIPRGTVFTTRDAPSPDLNVQAATLRDYVIAPGSVSITLDIYQGVLKKESFQLSSVTQNNYISLSSSMVSDGHSWLSHEDTLSNASPDERITQWALSGEDVYMDFRIGRFFSTSFRFTPKSVFTVIQLPFNWRNFVPSDALFHVEYLETSGSRGNTVAGRVFGVVGQIKDDTGVDLTKSVTISATSLSGGIDRESVESIKVNARTTIKELKTLVTLEDYEDFSRIDKGREAIALDWHIDPEVVPDPRRVVVYIDLGDYDDNRHDYDALESKLKTRQGRGDDVSVRRLDYVWYDIVAKVLLAPTGENHAQIAERAVQYLIYTLIEIPQKGMTHFRSRIIALLHEVSPRVVAVELESPGVDIHPKSTSVPRFRSVHLNFCTCRSTPCVCTDSFHQDFK